jgi:hypothetical protein
MEGRWMKRARNDDELPLHQPGNGTDQGDAYFRNGRLMEIVPISVDKSELLEAARL